MTSAPLPVMGPPAPLTLTDPMRRFAGGMLSREMVPLPVMAAAPSDGSPGAPITAPTQAQQMAAYKQYGFGPAHQFFRPTAPMQPAQGVGVGVGGMTREEIEALLNEWMAARAGPSAWAAGDSGASGFGAASGVDNVNGPNSSTGGDLGQAQY